MCWPLNALTLCPVARRTPEASVRGRRRAGSLVPRQLYEGIIGAGERTFRCRDRAHKFTGTGLLCRYRLNECVRPGPTREDRFEKRYVQIKMLIYCEAFGAVCCIR